MNLINDPTKQFSPTEEERIFIASIEEWRKEKIYPLDQIIEGSEENLFIYSLLCNWEDVALFLLPRFSDLESKMTMILRFVAKYNMIELLTSLKVSSFGYYLLSHEIIEDHVYACPLEIAINFGSEEVLSFFLKEVEKKDLLSLIEKGMNRTPSIFETLVRNDQASLLRELLLKTEIESVSIPYHPPLVKFIETLFRASLVFESPKVLTEIGSWFNLNLLAKNYNLLRYLIVSKREKILHTLMELVPDKREFLINRVLSKMCKMGHLQLVKDMLSFFDDPIELLSTLGFIPLKKGAFAGRTELLLYLLTQIKERGYSELQSLLHILLFEAEMGNRPETYQALLQFEI